MFPVDVWVRLNIGKKIRATNDQSEWQNSHTTVIHTDRILGAVA